MKRQSKATLKQQRAEDNIMDEESRGGFVPLSINSPTASELGTVAGGGGHKHRSIDNKRKKNGLREQLHSFRVMSAPYFRESLHGRILFG